MNRKIAIVCLVLVTLLVAVILSELYVSVTNVDLRMLIMNAVLKGQAKADYVYAMYSFALIHQFLVNNLGFSDQKAFILIDYLGIFFLCLSSCWFLIRLYSSAYSWYSGLLWIFITSPFLMKHPFYHPSDFYGVGLMFFILISAKEGRYWLLAILCFLSGMIWEKALFVPFIFFLYQIQKGNTDSKISLQKVKKAILVALPSFIATFFWYVFWRIKFPGVMREIHTWSEFGFQFHNALFYWLIWIAPIGIIFCDIIMNKKRIDRFWFYWLLYFPLLVGVIIYFRGRIGELRTFWILQPIFIGLIGNWIENVNNSKIVNI